MLLLALASLAACAAQPPPPWTELSQLPAAGRTAAFLKLPLETQLDLFVYDAGRTPPGHTYPLELATEGSPAAQAIAARMQRESNESVQLDLLRVVGIMRLLNKNEPARYPYDPGRDADLFVELNRAVTPMKSGPNKDAAVAELAAIYPDGKPR